MPLITQGDVTLYAERAGDGPPVLFISGTGSDLAVRPNGFDSPLAPAVDLVCYDHRGLGSSAQPVVGDEPWTMADYGDDAATILNWADWERATVIGVSFGGMVAQELLIRHPERIDRAVLVCTSSGGAGGASYPLHEFAALSASDRAAATVSVIDTRWDDATAEDSLRDYLMTALAAAPPLGVGALAQLEARRTHDTWDRLAKVDLPVLVCAGRYDGIAPLSNSEALAGQIPGARLEAFDGGHGFLYQDPRAWKVIQEFVLADVS